MGRKIIVVGDPTDHGGHVISGSPTQKINGKAIARLGDQVDCPQKGHGVNAIVEGDPSMLINGIPVALEGHKTACGCTLSGTVSLMHGGSASHANKVSAVTLMQPIQHVGDGRHNESLRSISDHKSSAFQSTMDFVALPLDSNDYYVVSGTSAEKLYGHPKTIRKIQEWARLWHAQHPEGGRIGVNDISYRDGAAMAPHKTHRNGFGVDIRPLRVDGLEKPVSIQQAAYSHELTKQLFILIANDPDCRLIYFNDIKIQHPIRFSIAGHDNHLHIEVRA